MCLMDLFSNKWELNYMLMIAECTHTQLGKMDFVGFYQIDCHINLWELRIYVNIVINHHRIHNTKLVSQCS